MVASLMRSTTSLMTSISLPAAWYRSVNNSSITSGDRLPEACAAFVRTSSRRSGLRTSAALAMNRSSRTRARAWARTPPALAASSSIRRVSSLSRCGSPAISSNACIVSESRSTASPARQLETMLSQAASTPDLRSRRTSA